MKNLRKWLPVIHRIREESYREVMEAQHLLPAIQRMFSLGEYAKAA